MSYLIGGFLKPFILPAGSVFVGLVIVFILIRKRKLRGASYLLIAIILFYYLLSIEPVSNILNKSLAQAANNKEVRNGEIGGIDAIVVLAGVPTERFFWESDPNSLNRFFMGIKIYRDLSPKVPIIFSSGVAHASFGQKKEYLRKDFIDNIKSFGIPEKDVIIEDRSIDTFENCTQTKNILDNLFPNISNHTIVLVTSPQHMLRASTVFKNKGIKVYNAQSLLIEGQLSRKKFNLNSFIPSADNFAVSTTAIYEWIGLSYYKLLGRI